MGYQIKIMMKEGIKMKEQLIKRLRNKAFLVSMIAAILLLIRQIGFNDLLPGNIDEIINSILAILSIAGIIVDPSSPGITDKVTEPVKPTVEEEFPIKPSEIM